MALRARIIVEGAFAGMHHNPNPGTAIEFAEHKEYAPGDEIRRIDWKAVGRQDRYYVKRFEDETEMRTLLLIDSSASMGYGRVGVSKLTYASYLAAALGYLLGKQGDPAGLLIHDEDVRTFLPPSGRAGHVREVLASLEAMKPGGRTDLVRLAQRAGDLAQRRSLIIVMSDLLDAEDDGAGFARGVDPGDETVARGPVAMALAQLALRGHDVVVFHVLSPDEVALPFDDLTQFLPVEPGDTRELLADADDLREAFAKESLAFRERWRRSCLQARVEYRFVTTDTPPGAVLRQFIGERRRGHRGGAG
jgi:uncharacterized protein (DUF58 family)